MVKDNKVRIAVAVVILGLIGLCVGIIYHENRPQVFKSTETKQVDTHQYDNYKCPSGECKG